MSAELTLTEFPPVSTAQWDEVVRKDLKGAAPKWKLFYRAEDLRGLEYLGSAPGQFPYTRGGRDDNDWSIRETVGDLAGARAAIDAGVDAIGFMLGAQNIGTVLDGLPLDRCAVHFEAGERAAELLAALANRPVARGSVDFEPLPDLDRAAELIRGARRPEFRPVTVRAHRFSLGLALAEGVEILAQLTERGFSAAEAASSMVFSFAIESDYFREIAKLRAARTVWARVTESFGAAAPMVIHAGTAHATKTIYDPHVNLLRATTQAMAAAIGGAEVIDVEPFDTAYRAPDEFSRHLARNLQLILKQEAWLDRSVDAAGGSYYIETLTDALCREAWDLLREIEAVGGFLKYSASGALDAALAKSRADREAAVGSRRTAIVGTNQYPNPQEHMLPKIEREDITPRLARIFEEIRLRTERHAARTGHTPRLLLLESGDLKMRKARSGFATSFFACAGFEVRTADALSGDPDAIVLCSSDAEYAALAPRVIQELRAAGKSTPVIVAGNPTDSIAQLKQAGVADFIHIRTNAAETLRAWQQRLGVSQ